MIYSSDQYHESGKKIDEPGKNPERRGELCATQICTSVDSCDYIGSDEPNGKLEKER